METEEYYWCCLRYIHNNPVKISLVKEPYEYGYSSAIEYYNGTSELIENKSYQMIKTRFKTSEEFWGYHRLFENKSFLDTVQDEQIHNYERVRILVSRYMFDNRIEEVQTILSIGPLKRDFLSECKRQTGLSERKIETILKTDCIGVRPLCKRV